MLRPVTSWLVYAGLGRLADLVRHLILNSTLDSILDSALKLVLLLSGFQNSLGAEEETELQIFISLATICNQVGVTSVDVRAIVRVVEIITR